MHSTDVLSLLNKILFSLSFRGNIYPSTIKRNYIWTLHCYRFLLSYEYIHINACSLFVVPLYALYFIFNQTIYSMAINHVFHCNCIKHANSNYI